MRRVRTVVMVGVSLLMTRGLLLAANDRVGKNARSILKHPKAEPYTIKKLLCVKPFNPDKPMGFQINLKNRDVSGLILTDRLVDLLHAHFDSRTIWPNTLPEGFKPQNIMDLGRNPGLKIGELHKQGITGKGVAIAIMDRPLLVGHDEYKERLMYYDEMNIADSTANMHGTGVASIAAGKATGVAPAARLYYIAEQHFVEKKDGSTEYDFNWTAKVLRKFLAINRNLPQNQKIRVVTLQNGWDETFRGGKEMDEAVAEATRQGVFFVSSSLYRTHGMYFQGLGRDPLKNPDSLSSYEPGGFWAKGFFENDMFEIDWQAYKTNQLLLFPMDSRTSAGSRGKNDYVFSRYGGWSWVTPFIAGLYALACQVKTSLTPEVFWKTALETGDTIQVVHGNGNFKLGKIVNPLRLMDRLQTKDIGAQ